MNATKTKPWSEAWKAAKKEGLSYFWAQRHVDGCSSTSFVGQTWEDGGFILNKDGDPRCDLKGNTVARFRVEPLDLDNAAHVAQVQEWYHG